TVPSGNLTSLLAPAPRRPLPGTAAGRGATYPRGTIHTSSRFWIEPDDPGEEAAIPRNDPVQATILAIGTSGRSNAPAAVSVGISRLTEALSTTVSTAW